jgi:starvation-inducible outer membrane lipoprotein
MKLILALSGALLVVGCSSLPTQVANNDNRTVCDQEKMRRAEAQAVSTGVQIYWLSCPQIKREPVKI